MPARGIALAHLIAMGVTAVRVLANLIVAVLVLSLAAGCRSVDRAQFAPQVEQAVRSTPEWLGRSARARRLRTIARQFYESRRYLPAWIDGVEATPALDDLLLALREATSHGLDPERYGVAALAAERARANAAWFGTAFDAARVAAIDVRLTYAFLAHAADLLGWPAPGGRVQREWSVAPEEVDLGVQLRVALETGAVRETLTRLAPSHPQYEGLRAALARYLQAGDPEAVKRLQTNLERWRWLPRDLGARYLLVNVPMYEMQMVERGVVVASMRVIVGAPETPTPLFSDRMTYVVFSPYWNIPESILREETLPRLVNDPGYLARNKMEVVGTSGEVIDPASVDWSDAEAARGLRFRQAPGPENALGLVKFIFPNHFSVYLHDTPGDSLFQRTSRALSHGCIRVEKPVALAEYVLRDRRWTRERIQAAMHSRREQIVRLQESIPVHIGYWTVWVQPDGAASFVDDPYALDDRGQTGVRVRMRSDSTP